MISGREEKQKPYKVAMIGDTGVGKTSIVARYTQGQFSNEHVSTIGTSYSECKVELEDKTVGLSIWDTAGQERFRSLIPLYMRNANACVIVFSVADRVSFADLDEIYESAMKTAGDVYMVLCGNKSDTIPCYDTTAAVKWAHDHRLSFFLTSAKTGEGVSEMFMDIANALSGSSSKVRDEVPLTHPRVQEKGCC